MSKVTITVEYETGKADWQKYPTKIEINGNTSNLNALREIILGFQPPENNPNAQSQ